MPIEINPMLKPGAGSGGGKWRLPGFGGGGDGDSGGGGKQPADGSPRIKPLFPGFFFRLGALAIDFLALYLIAYGLNAVLREPLLRLGPASLLVACAVMLAYFSILNGPIGCGATLGKQLLQLRVVDRQGHPIGLTAALVRSVVETLPILGYLLLSWFGRDIYLPVAALITISVLISLCEGYWIANAMMLLMNPLRRSLQDRVVGSFVIHASYAGVEDLPERIETALQNAPRPNSMQRALITSAFFIFAIISLFTQIPAVRSPQWQRQLADMRQLQTNLGADSLQVRIESLHDVPAGGKAVEQREADQMRQGGIRLPGPRVLVWPVTLVSYRALSDADRQSLKQLQWKLPQLRQYLSAMLAEAHHAADQKQQGDDFQKQLKELDITQGMVDLQVIETLDFGFEFPGEAVLDFRQNFSEPQLRTMGINPAPASSPAKTQ